MRHIVGHLSVPAIAGLLVIAVCLVPGGAQRAVAQRQAGDDLDVVQLRPNFYVIAGAGGNIVMQTGPMG
ncbi:MAG: hypothetical protein EHM35_10285, partial [Planctomycetaceae bacterium]